MIISKSIVDENPSQYKSRLGESETISVLINIYLRMLLWSHIVDKSNRQASAHHSSTSTSLMALVYTSYEICDSGTSTREFGSERKEW